MPAQSFDSIAFELVKTRGIDFVTNSDYLFRNRGNGTFGEIGFMTGVAYPESGRPLSGMGADARDVDDDGLGKRVVKEPEE